MIKTGIKEARQNFTALLTKVQKGEEVLITKRGEPIAKLSASGISSKAALKSHKTLRETITATGKPLSKVVSESRAERI
jgi:antitoxin (DNA-binding transcriptional repressor) of toxin-antitoxin stability system